MGRAREWYVVHLVVCPLPGCRSEMDSELDVSVLRECCSDHLL